LDKIIITSDEININNNINSKSSQDQSVPIWWRLISGLFILVPPILFLIIIMGLIRNRRKNASVKYSYALHYCLLLIISGIIWLFLWAFFNNNNIAEKTQKPSIAATSISIKKIPKLPSEGPFSGKDIASAFLPMVIAIHPTGMEGIINNDRIYGAGVIVAITKEGCLFMTSKHVINAIPNYQNKNHIVSISLNDGQQAIAKVVGMHKKLDLSLLWINKTRDYIKFLQPVRNYNTIEAGESIFVIGHPEGLTFSISNGLISQKRNEELIQISAPVSPGNSGGPVYDEYGNLIGIVQSVLDKVKKPNAENLNFAVRADAILDKENWSLSDIGTDLISLFSTNNISGN